MERKNKLEIAIKNEKPLGYTPINPSPKKKMGYTVGHHKNDMKLPKIHDQVRENKRQERIIKRSDNFYHKTDTALKELESGGKIKGQGVEFSSMLNAIRIKSRKIDNKRRNITPKFISKRDIKNDV